MNQTQQQPLSTPHLVAYGLPAIALAALTLPLYLLVPTFYTETIGLSLAEVGFAFFLVRIFDAINDPLIGWLSDRFKPAFGRRRFWLVASTPIVIFSAYKLFWPPIDVGTNYILIWGLLLSIGYSAAILPYSAWGAELANNYQGRSRITAMREGLILVGTLIAILMDYAMGRDNPSGIHGLALIAISVAIALPVFVLIAVRTLPEPKDHSKTQLNIKDGVSHLIANKPFLRLITAFLINGLANGLPSTLFLFFVSYRLGLPESREILLLIYFICAIAGVPFWTYVAGKTSKHRAWCIAMTLASIVFAFAPLLPQGAYYSFLVICILTGFCVGADLSLPAAIQADVIDVDTAQSGEQRSGTYFAAWSLATKLSLSIAIVVAFPLLDWFGLNAQAPENSTASGLYWLGVLYAWVPIALKLTAIGLMFNFPLGQTEVKALRKRIS